MTGSNRRPPACKAGALPAELIPLGYYILVGLAGLASTLPPGLFLLVGLVGLEPTTPALSTRCSNQLSYSPNAVLLRLLFLLLLTADKCEHLMREPVT